MIGLILGTSEGKDILSRINTFTDDIFISTATEYGGSLLKDYKYKYLNHSPLDFDGFIKVFEEKHINVLIDASHPYAVDVSQNAMKACRQLSIEYIRYERPSCIKDFKSNEKVIEVKGYEELHKKLLKIKGNILDTTGSKNLRLMMDMKLKNRIVHRVLPLVNVLKKCSEIGIKIEDIIAIKGPVSYELNCAFIKDYDIEAVILKDSGLKGGTHDKIKACLHMNVYAFIIGRKKMNYNNVFNDISKMIDYITIKYILRG
ncbi:cobalt-precorrin-6A reductase [Clostridium tyrobutyricum]|uniref:cobalt-precorrin-6A reductase n=1 Tax=Clostridium tyrobutyricum TaxID=1519 RepID=UPI00057EC935|nr:cobalt-precorrin-6A reductase [Clostridium tyrobutyricum]